MKRLQRATGDFETRSRLDVRKVNSTLYAQHESTRPLCFAYHLPGMKRPKLWKPGDKPPKKLFKWVKAGKLFEAHNAIFEYCIWNLIMVPRYGWPPLKVKQMLCSAAKCRAMGLPGGLEAAGKALKLNTTKDEEGKRLLALLSLPQRITKDNDKEWCNDKKELKRLYKYCVQDVVAEIVISNSLPDLIPIEVETFRLDMRINLKGIYVDKEGVDAALKILDKYRLWANKRIRTLTRYKVHRGTQGARILKWCESRKFHIENMQAETVKEALKNKKIPKDVKEVLTLQQAVSKTSTGKYTRMATFAANDGRIKESLLYYKAHTGRWGGKDLQPQNLPRPTMKIDPDGIVEDIKTLSEKKLSKKYGNPFLACVNACRPMLTAAPDKLLCAADFSAIEACGVMWLAGEREGMKLLSSANDCIYTEIAAEIFNVKYRKLLKAYKSGDYEADKKRFIGKQCILGLGYQMGWKTFRNDMSDKFNVEITVEFAKHVVKLYRSKYKKVVALWHGLNEAAIDCVATGQKTQYGSIKFSKYGHWLRVELPSKRAIYYPNVRLGRNKFSQACVEYHSYEGGHYTIDNTYGGKLCENIVQGIARDILRDAMLRLDRAGEEIVLTIHDEVITEIGKKKPVKKLATIEDLLTINPSWAKKMPLNVEGWTGKRYRKG